MRWNVTLVALGVVVAGLSPMRAFAHQVGISRGEYRLEDSSLRAELVFAREELLGLVPTLDGNQDGTLAEAELESGRESIQALLRTGVSVRADGTACAGALLGTRLVEEDGVALETRFTCERAPSRASVDLALLQGLPHGHRHLAHVASGHGNEDAVLLRGATMLEVGTSAVARGSVVGSLLWMGVVHILSGLDHLVFLFGLILVGGRLRGLLMTITAFTVAHSITIALAVLGVWAPSPSFVEPAIALSVAYVGVENFFVKNANRRWLITFPFGLVHGFGFAGALGELAVPRAQLIPALVSFNLGVEAGQLAVLAVVLPLLFWARQRPWFLAYGVQALSAVVVLLGVGWFTLRVTGLG
jgi:hydrogenase/urease accessory protein HupE